jgi:hypothetical protein
MLCAVGGKVVADVADPFLRGEELLGDWNVVDIVSPKVGNQSPQFDAWRTERGRLLISEQVVHGMDFECSFKK